MATFNTITGTVGADDLIVGGVGDDSVLALAGNDTVTGSGSNDRVDLGTGNDLVTKAAAYTGGSIFGGDGNDILTGGDGADIFEFVNSAAAQTDTITDYTSDDTLKFYLGDGDSQITEADFQNGTLAWGNLTIALDSSLAWDDLSVIFA